jgi:hypothetical protein
MMNHNTISSMKRLRSEVLAETTQISMESSPERVLTVARNSKSIQKDVLVNLFYCKCPRCYPIRFFKSLKLRNFHQKRVNNGLSHVELALKTCPLCESLKKLDDPPKFKSQNQAYLHLIGCHDPSEFYKA